MNNLTFGKVVNSKLRYIDHVFSWWCGSIDFSDDVLRNLFHINAVQTNEAVLKYLSYCNFVQK